MIWKAASLLLQLAFGALFFYSGITKLRDPIAFLDDVRRYKIFDHIATLTGAEISPSPWEAWVAMGLPWLEILCGVCVLLGVCSRGALVILCGALTVFILAISSAWARGLDINCGCFGGSAPISDYQATIWQRVGLLAVGIALLVIAIQRASAAKSLAEDQ